MMNHDWEYHQNGRDRAATLGCFGIMAIFLILVCVIAASIARAYMF